MHTLAAITEFLVPRKLYLCDTVYDASKW